jgi:integrase
MSVYKRSDGKSPFYQYEFEIDGNRFRGSTKCSSEREALAYERGAKERARQELAERVARQAAPDTIDDVFARYWKAHGHKLSWADSVRAHMNDMLEFFGALKPFAEIGNADVAAMLEAYEATEGRKNRDGTVRGGRPAPSTVNRRLSVLQGIYTTARDEWEMPVKVVVWKKHRRKEPKARVRHIDTERAKELVRSLPHNIMLMAAWSFATGCRKNETKTLAWSRVNYETMQAEVLTKGGGTRFVDLGPDAISVLSMCDRNRVLVFNARNLRRSFETARKVAGLEDFRWHDMRHCFATWAGNRGVDIAVLQGLLGHSDIRVTTKYRRVIRSDMQKAVQKLPTLIEGTVVPLKRTDAE